MDTLYLLVLIVIIFVTLQILSFIVFYHLMTTNFNKQFQNQKDFFEASFRDMLDRQIEVHTSSSLPTLQIEPDKCSKSGHVECVSNQQAEQSPRHDVQQEYYDDETSSDTSDEIDDIILLPFERSPFPEEIVEQSVEENVSTTIPEIDESDVKEVSEASPELVSDDGLRSIINDVIDGRKDITNLKHLVYKTEKNIHFHGDVNAVMIGEQNILKNKSVHQNRIKKPQAADEPQRRSKTRTKPNMKIHHQIKDPMNEEDRSRRLYEERSSTCVTAKKVLDSQRHCFDDQYTTTQVDYVCQENSSHGFVGDCNTEDMEFRTNDEVAKRSLVNVHDPNGHNQRAESVKDLTKDGTSCLENIPDFNGKKYTDVKRDSSDVLSENETARYVFSDVDIKKNIPLGLEESVMTFDNNCRCKNKCIRCLRQCIDDAGDINNVTGEDHRPVACICRSCHFLAEVEAKLIERGVIAS